MQSDINGKKVTLEVANSNGTERSQVVLPSCNEIVVKVIA